MANTYNPKGTESKEVTKNKEGFNPSVDNSDFSAKASGMGKFMIYLSFIFIFPIFIYIGSRNHLLRLQNQINESASGIDVQLTRRRDTLIKLIDATKGIMNFERTTYAEITKLRTGTNPAKLNEVNTKLNSAYRRFNLQMENYPQLRSNEAVQELMQNASSIEAEISATRRLYNSYVREFNQRIYTYPSNVIADSMRLNKLPFFEASEQQKADVKIEI